MNYRRKAERHDLDKAVNPVLELRRSHNVVRFVGMGLLALSVVLPVATGEIAGSVLVFVIGLVWFLAGSPLVVTVDRACQLLTIQTRYPVKPKRREIPFSALASVSVDYVRQSRSRFYQTVLVLQSGERVGLLRYKVSRLEHAQEDARSMVSSVSRKGFVFNEVPVNKNERRARRQRTIYVAEQQSIERSARPTDLGAQSEVGTTTYGGLPAGQWKTLDGALPSGFVLISQQKDGSLLRGRFAARAGLNIVARGYGLCDRQTLKTGKLHKVPGLGGAWMVLASTHEATERLFTDRVIRALDRWAELHPVRAYAGAPQRSLGPITIFADESGLSISILGHLGGERLQAVSDLGAEMANAVALTRRHDGSD